MTLIMEWMLMKKPKFQFLTCERQKRKWVFNLSLLTLTSLLYFRRKYHITFNPPMLFSVFINIAFYKVAYHISVFITCGSLVTAGEPHVMEACFYWYCCVTTTRKTLCVDRSDVSPENISFMQTCVIDSRRMCRAREDCPLIDLQMSSFSLMYKRNERIKC